MFAGVTFYVTYKFIGLDVINATTDKNITLGEALLRITSLIIPGYLTLFCANQFFLTFIIRL